MKKVFMYMAVAAAASLTFAACNNNNQPAEEVDSTAVEQVVVEEPVIAEPVEVADETPAVEEQKAPAKEKKTQKATKKENPPVVTATPTENTEAKAEVPAAAKSGAEGKEVTTVKRKSARK